MNERIRELMAEVGMSVDYLTNTKQIVLIEKFAELIVRECAGLCSQAAEENARTFYAVSETKEVGPALVAKGGQVQAEKLVKHIKQHFGVEE